MDEGLRVLRAVKEKVGVPVLTDIHEVAQAKAAAEVCDVLQIPAFLCRQTDLLLAAGRSGAAVNIKKGQFLAPQEMSNAVEKVESTGNRKIILTERGNSFGYQNLVVDMRSFAMMRKLGYPVVFDVTHAVQLPGGAGKASGGQPEFIEPLARAGVAAGVDGIFMEVHDNPAKALSDGANALPLENFEPLLREIETLGERGAGVGREMSGAEKPAKARRLKAPGASCGLKPRRLRGWRRAWTSDSSAQWRCWRRARGGLW